MHHIYTYIYTHIHIYYSPCICLGLHLRQRAVQHSAHGRDDLGAANTDLGELHEAKVGGAGVEPFGGLDVVDQRREVF